MLSVEERLRRVREELRAEKDAHARTREARERTCQELDDFLASCGRVIRPDCNSGP